jgi:hypothetical protein
MPLARSALPKKRTVAGLAAASIVGALLTPALGVGPAAATPCARPSPYGALASADLVKLGVLDLRPLGLRLGPVADVRIASARSGMATANPSVNTAAAARYLEAHLLGVEVPTGPLDTSVAQKAPPDNPQPAEATALMKDLGILSVGTGKVRAHARFSDGLPCGRHSGKTAESSAAVLDASVLPGAGGTALVKVPDNLAAETATALVEQHGVVRSMAGASVGLADIRIFAGTRSELRIEVIRPPTLVVSTGGSRERTSVEYTSPILKISGAGLPSQRLDAPGTTIDVALPPAGGNLGEAAALARQVGLPLLGGDPLRGMLGSLGPTGLSGIRSGRAAAPLALPGVPKLADVPTLPAVGGLIGHGTESLAGLPGAGRLSILRLSLGELEQQITHKGVRAQAASLRLQVLAVTPAPAKPSAKRKKESTSSVVDLGIGLLEASAVAPRRSGYGPSTPPPPPSGNGGGLPVTGADVGLVVGAGLLLLIAGRFLLLFSRRQPLG